MAKGSSRNRVVLQLDPRIALEAILLNRIERVPKTRQQEWLRGLLVQGFRIECQALREISVVTKTERGMRFSDWLSGNSTKKLTSPKSIQKQKPVAPAVVQAINNAAKPFAQLSRVIG